MADNSTDHTRRRVLQAAGVSITAVLAGCGSGGSGTTQTASSTGTSTQTQAQTTTSPPESPQGQIEELSAYPRIKVTSMADLGTGNVQQFDYPLQGQQNFITKLDTEAWGGVGENSNVVAFNAACTHAGCSVAGNVAPKDHMAGPCPCHFTSFDLTKGGLVVLGQATTDLPQIRLEVENGDVYATGMDNLVWGYHNNLRDGTPIQAARQSETGEQDGTSAPTTTSAASSGSGEFGGWFDNVSNFDSVADKTGQGEVTVTVGAEGNNGAFAFAPPAIRVSTGTTVVWEWTGKGGQHNVVDQDSAFESKLVTESGHTFSYMFGESGTFRYYCQPHQSLGMKGAVVVE